MNFQKRFGSLFLLCFAGLTSSCAHDDASQKKKLSEQRQMLAEGYSILYQDASKIDQMGLVLYLKVETDEFDAYVTRVSDYGEELKRKLETVARDYPGVRIDLDPLPEMETRKRTAIGKDRALMFLPLTGRGGREYERTMLISLSNALNHESHLCRVLAEEEPDAGLKKFLLESEKSYQSLYEGAMDLLNRRHFKVETQEIEKKNS